MKKVTLKKDWPIRSGVLIPSGTKIELDENHESQMKKAGMLKDSINLKSQ